MSPNFRRMTAFSPSQATLTVEMSQKESILWTGSAFEVDIGQAS
jgi:hypothetical protein